MTETTLGPDGKEYPTGDLEPLLRCERCDQLKPINGFHFQARNTFRLQRHKVCKDCRRPETAAYKARKRAEKGPDPRQVRQSERRARVAELYGQNWSFTEIVSELGVASSTITRDLNELGLSGRQDRIAGTIAPKSNVTIADNVINQLADLSHLVYDGRRIVLQLEGLTVPPEMAAQWEKNLAQVGKALRYLRSHAKKGNTT